MQTTQAVGSVEANPIGLSEDVSRIMVKALDENLTDLIALFHQYFKHHWLVKGPQFRDLHHFFEDKYKELEKDFDSVAERITMLGGIPTTSMIAQEQKASISPEEEGDHPIREMVSKDLQDETSLAVRMRSAIQYAMENKDFGSEYLLKELLFHCENRAHELDNFLASDTLELVARQAVKGASGRKH